MPKCIAFVKSSSGQASKKMCENMLVKKFFYRVWAQKFVREYVKIWGLRKVNLACRKLCKLSTEFPHFCHNFISICLRRCLPTFIRSGGGGDDDISTFYYSNSKGSKVFRGLIFANQSSSNLRLQLVCWHWLDIGRGAAGQDPGIRANEPTTAHWQSKFLAIGIWRILYFFCLSEPTGRDLGSVRGGTTWC